jgi:hypothetical protein
VGFLLRSILVGCRASLGSRRSAETRLRTFGPRRSVKTRISFRISGSVWGRLHSAVRKNAVQPQKSPQRTTKQKSQ